MTVIGANNLKYPVSAFANALASAVRKPRNNLVKITICEKDR